MSDMDELNAMLDEAVEPLGTVVFAEDPEFDDDGELVGFTVLDPPEDVTLPMTVKLKSPIEGAEVTEDPSDVLQALWGGPVSLRTKGGLL